MNGQFPIAVHILTLLAKADGETLSSDYIAGSININPALVRKEIRILRNRGLIASKEGKSGGYNLGKAAAKINLADIYQAIKQLPLLGVAKNTPNPACPVGKEISRHLNTLYDEMDNIINKSLANITLADFTNQFS